MKLCTLGLVCLIAGAQTEAPQIRNARLDTRAAADLVSEAAAIARRGDGAWFGYTVATVRGGDWRGCSNVVRLEGSRQTVILFRIERGSVARIRTTEPECEIDAGGQNFTWFTGVNPAKSVALLASLVRAGDNGSRDQQRVRESALSMLGQHEGREADQLLEQLAAAGQPDWQRERAMSHIGSQRGRAGLDALKRLLDAEKNERMRERLVSALGGSREPEAVDLLASIARKDASDKVARQAVHALARMDAAGIAPLIEMARARENPNLRKEAMQTLGRSKDPRARAFVEEFVK